jgi:membrane-bound lytic murein transglycosylase D
VTIARERIESIAARFQTTPQVIRSANSIPANMQPKAGSTLIVPKTTLGSEMNIDQDITENSVLALEPDNLSFRPSRQQSSVKRQPAASPYGRPAQRKPAPRQ